MDLVLGVCSALGACQMNVVLLEMVGTMQPCGFYALTCLQYVAVSLLSLPLLLHRCQPEKEPAGSGAVATWRWRPLRLVYWHRWLVAVVSWVVTVGNNMAFGFALSVPVHATCRSSSLMVNMLFGYWILGRRFSVQRVFAALTVFAGLVILTVHKAQRQHRTASGEVSVTAHAQAEDTTRWLCGVGLLMGMTMVLGLLSVFQEYMFRVATERHKANTTPVDVSHHHKAGKKDAPHLVYPTDAPPLWAEAVFFSHALALPLFLTRPQMLMDGLQSLSSAPRAVIIGNCLTQFVCIGGVFVLSSVTSAFATSLVLALRKLITFFFSVIFFQHYHHMTGMEWLAMLAAILAATAYPFLP